MLALHWAQRPRAPRWASASGGHSEDCRRVAARSSCSGCLHTAVSRATSGPTPSPRRPAPWTRPPQLWTSGPRTGRQPDWHAPVPSRPGRSGGTACLWALGAHLPSPIARGHRLTAVDVHQLRATGPSGHWPLDRFYPVATQDRPLRRSTSSRGNGPPVLSNIRGSLCYQHRCPDVIKF